MSTERLRLLVAEDVDLVAEAFVALLATEPGFAVVGRVSRGDQVVPAVRALRPDVAVLDVDMPGLDGIEAAAAVRDAAPERRILVLTALAGPGHLHRALANGADGYLTKTTTAARLIEGTRTVAEGGTVIDPDLATTALRLGQSPLTAREADILRLVGNGVSTDAIAIGLSLTRGTVRNYLSHAMVKLEVTGRSAAAALAESRGWL